MGRRSNYRKKNEKVGNGPENVMEEEGDSDVAKGTEEEIKGEKDITKGVHASDLY